MKKKRINGRGFDVRTWNRWELRNKWGDLSVKLKQIPLVVFKSAETDMNYHM